MRTISLIGPLDWATAPIPAGTPDVQISRLRVNAETKASTSLVRFPTGWSRTLDVFYAVDEELVVIEGELIVSGVSYTAGQYGFIPAGSLRRLSATPNGCLALAHFAGIPAPLSEEEARATDVGPTLRLDLSSHRLGSQRSTFGIGQQLRSRPYGECCLIDGDVDTSGATEVLNVDTWTWTHLMASGGADGPGDGQADAQADAQGDGPGDSDVVEPAFTGRHLVR
jgi:Domain of unknown function (DUF4437)